MLIHVPLESVVDNPYQRRAGYGDVESLAADIRTRGLLQVPRGRLLFDGQPQTETQTRRVLEPNGPGWPAGQSFRVQLAFGHRRLRAYRHLAEANGGSWTAMPVYVEALTDDAMLDAVWSENQHRSDINPIEQAELLAEKLDRIRAAGGSQTTLATEWGLDRSTIANKLRLLDLPPDVQAAVRERKLSERQATALLPVLELQTKLNGTPAAWSDTGGPSWHPCSPAGYIADVITNPDKVTSDTIRNYAQAALRHAGRPLGDAFAAYDAGQGQNIVQPACKGCPRRQNQTCLDPRCHDARAERYRAAVAGWASAATGLPFSDDPADFEIDYHERAPLQARYRAGDHTGLVVGIHTNYSEMRPFSTENYVRSEVLFQDWKQALAIGRNRYPAAQDDPTPAPSLPRPTELIAWRKTQEKANRDRAKRAKAALRTFAVGLLDNETGLRVLAALHHGYDLRQYQDKGQTPTAEQLLDLLFEKGWRSADTVGHSYNTDQSNRTALRDLLHAAAISRDIVDPPDPALRLLDIGQLALLTYDATRSHVGRDKPYERLRRLREALAEFNAAPTVVAANDDLTTLATYLAAAVAREEQRLDAAEPTPEAA